MVNICPAQIFFEIQLAVYSALSSLADLAIYYITRCGIWLVNNISYSIYPLSTKTEKAYITQIIPFFFLFSIRRTFIDTNDTSNFLNTRLWLSLDFNFFIMSPRPNEIFHLSVMSLHVWHPDIMKYLVLALCRSATTKYFVISLCRYEEST